MNRTGKVALLYGGPSVEREISLMTAKNVEQAFKELGIDFLSMEADFNNLQKLNNSQIEKAFLAVHGTYGEDGALQGLLEYLKIPYTGSGVLSSALCMDKVFFKDLISFHRILTPAYKHFSFPKDNGMDSPPFLPCVVKPSRSGSSIGVYICHSSEDWKKALEAAIKIDSCILVEKYIKGAEVAVSWLDGRVLTPVEVEPLHDHFYDFKRKYEKNQTQYFVPPKLKPDTIEKMKNITQQVQKICHVRSYCRCDFIVDSEENIYILELNTLPGLTSLSLVPKSAKHDGISYAELILKILNGAQLA